MKRRSKLQNPKRRVSRNQLRVKRRRRAKRTKKVRKRKKVKKRKRVKRNAGKELEA